MNANAASPATDQDQPASHDPDDAARPAAGKNADPSSIGGKAAALRRLRRLGFRIPPFLVVRPNESIDPDRLAAGLARLKAGRFAVRSSAVAEDGTDHSFAGQFESHLNVAPADVPSHINKVRASGAAARVAAYQRDRGLNPGDATPAALVQAMIEPHAAGVAFSVDPVSGRRSTALVSAVPGLGDQLVSGETDADTWEIDPGGRVTGRRPAPGRATMCLGDDDAASVAALARRCQDHFGRPQDIEWAIDHDGALWLLQSRPITTLAGLPDPDDQLRIWDNSNIAESYAGLVTPLTFSFARRAYEAVYRQFCRLMRVSETKLAAHDEVFPQMLGRVRGRVYYNLLSWYRVLALLPGFSVNRRFMEQMMGVREPLPEDLTEEVIAAVRTSRWSDSLALARSGLGLLLNALTLNRSIRRFHHRLDRALASGPLPIERLSLDQLVRHYRDLETRLLKRWDAPLVNDFFAMISYGVLRALCRRWAGDRDGTLQNQLVAGVDGIVSAEPPRLIRAMAELTPPDLAATLLDPSLDAIDKLNALRRHEALTAAWNAYLQRFGDRCLHELKLESPTVEDDPTTLLTAIGVLAMRSHDTPGRPPAPAPDTDTSSVTGNAGPEQENPPALPRGWRGWLFRRVLNVTRARVRDRENLRFERTRVFGRVRRVFRAIGRNLHADGALDRADDIFFLEVEEVLRLVEGASTVEQPAALARLRRLEMEQWQDQPAPPDRFSTRGPLHRHAELRADPPAGSAPDPAAGADGDRMQGVGACPGVVRGRVRVVDDPAAAVLQAGEILVARQTDPGWVVLFAAAAGLLVERGSLLSHSAIVSREMNLPCVVTLPGLLDWLHTDDEVEFDGRTGVITRLSPANPAPTTP